MYHNNKDNSIKTPIMARYNTLSGETQTGEYSVVYLSSYESQISVIYLSIICEIFVSTFLNQCVLPSTCDNSAELFTGL